MIKELFTYTHLYKVSDLIIQFYNCKFIKECESLKVGDRRYCVVIDFENGILETYGGDNEEVYESIKICLDVKTD